MRVEADRTRLKTTGRTHYLKVHSDLNLATHCSTVVHDEMHGHRIGEPLKERKRESTHSTIRGQENPPSEYWTTNSSKEPYVSNGDPIPHLLNV